MKTYEEMAQSVIRRAKAHRTARNCWIAGSVAAVLVLGLCTGILVMNRPAEEPTLQTLPATEANHRVTFLYHDGRKTGDLQRNVQTPCQMELRIQDVRGLSEEDKEAVCKAEEAYAKALIAANPDAQGYQWAQWSYSNIVVTSVSAGHFIIAMEDPRQIESITATVDGVLHMSHMSIDDEDYWLDATGSPAKKFILNHEDIQKAYYPVSGGVEIGWRLSNNAMENLNRGTVSVGDLRDTVTFTVTYVDGTTENHTIDMISDENGKVYAVYRGATAVA